ncbi:MAG: 3-oxoacyl-[acyl-carrier-protein] reductase [Actinobacteria bacterium]|nr:3-oxoacyl-[acyl-carrier-protein] reductase [Actinomycetota bacterium]MBU4313622.1 3-oxoacyl-[acyl-carrier-protein] reductase [Actinomycetota bacterium]MBU4482970.1 3-oxoacyl-[acyl-carrier-protein] reductase [Actinomycetota bacterium]MCG2790493.1 3-oxoacyl-[acyl-carrier-protein] reductase [Actinomycetes bacterium]
MRLKDRVAIITGGARGIGKKISQTFLKEGASVYIFDVNQEEGARTVGELQPAYDGKVIFFKVDITDEKSVEQSIEKIIEAEGRIDILVNNAGITRDNLILRMSLEDWKKVIDINLTGAFICSKHTVKYMVKNRSGKIINISSIVGVHGNAGQSNYSSSKAGIIGLTKTLARELAGRNILVNAIAPGYIETEMTKKLSDKIKEKLMEQIPTGRLGSVDDVAKTALFLASDDSNYITGTVINLDGGMGI